jgi:hypothetical protein
MKIFASMFVAFMLASDGTPATESGKPRGNLIVPPSRFAMKSMIDDRAIEFPIHRLAGHYHTTSADGVHPR